MHQAVHDQALRDQDEAPVANWTEPDPLPEALESSTPRGSVHGLAVCGPVIATTSDLGIICIRDFRTGLLPPFTDALECASTGCDQAGSKFWDYGQA